MTCRSKFIVPVVLFATAGFFYLVSPWVAAFVRHERLSRYIKIRTEYPGCVPGKKSFDSFKCECEFIFEGVNVPGDVTFDGSGLKESYDARNHTYLVSGTGTILAASNRISISSDRISINGTELPPHDGASSFHVLIGSDGKLTNSRIDISW